MRSVLNIKTISDYNNLIGQQTFHPLVSIVDFSNVKAYKQPTAYALNFGFYAVFFKSNEHCEIRYGRNNYDYQEGTLIFIGPGQVVSIEEDGEDYKPSGVALLFHPDFIKGSSLGQHIKDYTFFSYNVHEALHLSESERQVVLDCFNKIDYELRQSIDKHSKKLIVANIELFFNYSVRFYDRQFITRDHANTGILEKFDNMLNEYF
ncbi:MAG: hypothetical protein NVSMB45_11910 [Ginsengibacter sp.]